MTDPMAGKPMGYKTPWPIKHGRYLSYVMRHKWFVFLECCKLGIPWRGIVHDLSKFRLREWRAYANWFYTAQGDRFNGGYAWEFGVHERYAKAFNRAWLYHQHANPHHWQYWILREDSGSVFELEMPLVCLKEMVADWRGMSRTFGKKPGRGTFDWFHQQYQKMRLHEKTEEIVQAMIQAGLDKEREGQAELEGK